MVSKMIEPEHLVIAVLVLLVALLVATCGKGLGELIAPLLKKILNRGEVTVNFEGGDVKKPKECEQCGLLVSGHLVDPSKCPLHANEHERSLRNEQGIKDVTVELKDTRRVLFGKLEGIEVVLGEIKIAVAKLVVERNYQMDERSRRK